MTKHVPKIISALVGLALVGYGGWLTLQGQTEPGLLVLGGGLGTLGLPALISRKPAPPADSEDPS